MRSLTGIWLAFVVLAIILAAGANTAAARRNPPPRKGPAMSLTLTSSAFKPQGEIPRRYTCEGENVSPPLAWSGAPAGTKSFALIVDDPDAPDPGAPKVVWVHWVVYDIPAGTTSIAEGAKGLTQGLNDWKKAEWGGPCPPIGRHRYFFKLYALDITLQFIQAPTKADLEGAMKGHILAQAELIGRYQKTLKTQKSH